MRRKLVATNDYRGMRGGRWHDVSGGLGSSSAAAAASPTGGGYSTSPGSVWQVSPSPPPSRLLLASAACLLGLRLATATLRRKIVACLAVLSLAWSAGLAHADVFNMGGTRNPTTGVWTGEASLLVRHRGRPWGNATVISTGSFWGAVGYVYQMGKYDVTVLTVRPIPQCGGGRRHLRPVQRRHGQRTGLG